MKQTFNFNTIETITITNDKLAGFYLDFTHLKADDTTAPLVDPKKINISAKLHKGKNSLYVYNTTLEKFVASKLSPFEASLFLLQSQLDLRCFIGHLSLNGNDKLIIEIKTDSSAFTDLDLSKSSITLETIPTNTVNNIIYQLEEFTVRDKTTTPNQSLGSKISKITFFNNSIVDQVAYVDSAGAKLTNVDLQSTLYNFDVSADLIYKQNVRANQYYATDDALGASAMVRNLDIYNSEILLNGVRISGTLNQAADADSSFLVVRKLMV